MDRQQLISSSDSAMTVRPLDIAKPEWNVSQTSIHADSLIVQHSILQADELEYPGLAQHLVSLQLSHGNHHVGHIADQKHEGSFPVGEFLLNPATYPAFYSWDSTDEIIVFIVEPKFLARTAALTECLNPDQIELNPIAIGRDFQIEYIARSFLAEMQSDGLGGRLYSEALATQFAIHLLRNYCTFPAQLKYYEGGLSRLQLKAVISYIDAYFASNISLKELALVAQINSHHHFCRLFKQSTGIAPYQYVIEQRIEKAKQLLKQKELPLVEVALSCGFSSQSTFSRTFGKRVGTTPKNYRQQL